MMKIKNNSIHILVNRKPVAWLTFELVNSSLEIYTIQVHQRWRGYGFAKQLLKQVLSLYQNDAKACILGGDSNIECINLLTGFGFTKIYNGNILYMYLKR